LTAGKLKNIFKDAGETIDIKEQVASAEATVKAAKVTKFEAMVLRVLADKDATDEDKRTVIDKQISKINTVCDVSQVTVPALWAECQRLIGNLAAAAPATAAAKKAKK
jgi:hypothetical protein